MLKDNNIPKINGDNSSNIIPDVLKYFLQIKLYENTIIYRVRDSKHRGGFFQKLKNNSLMNELNISKEEQLFLMLRLLYIYNNNGNIKNQIDDIEKRRLIIKKYLLDFLGTKYTSNSNINHNEIMEFLFNKLFK